MEFSYAYTLFTFITRHSNMTIYSNKGDREIEVFFRFSTYWIRAVFRVYKSIEIYYLTKLKG